MPDVETVQRPHITVNMRISAPRSGIGIRYEDRMIGGGKVLSLSQLIVSASRAIAEFYLCKSEGIEASELEGELQAAAKYLGGMKIEEEIRPE